MRLFPFGKKRKAPTHRLEGGDEIRFGSADEALRFFREHFSAAFKEIEGGRVEVDAGRIRKIVRALPDTIYRVVESECVDARGDPRHLQGALLLATIYQVEFGDDALVKLVRATATATGAEDQLNILRGIKL